MGRGCGVEGESGIGEGRGVEGRGGGERRMGMRLETSQTDSLIEFANEQT